MLFGSIICTKRLPLSCALVWDVPVCSRVYINEQWKTVRHVRLLDIRSKLYRGTGSGWLKFFQRIEKGEKLRTRRTAICTPKGCMLFDREFGTSLVTRSFFRPVRCDSIMHELWAKTLNQRTRFLDSNCVVFNIFIQKTQKSPSSFIAREHTSFRFVLVSVFHRLTFKKKTKAAK